MKCCGVEAGGEIGEGSRLSSPCTPTKSAFTSFGLPPVKNRKIWNAENKILRSDRATDRLDTWVVSNDLPRQNDMQGR